EAGDVLAQVGRKLRGFRKEFLEVEARCVVEGKTGGLAELRGEILELPVAQFGLPTQHLFLGGSQHAIEAAQHGTRKDDGLVLAALEGVANQICDAPEEAHDLAM